MAHGVRRTYCEQMNAQTNSARCLVTVGAGFIGSHLVERLLGDGHTVAVLDNFSTGRIENLNQIKNNPRLFIYRVDISNYAEIKQFFEDVDWVFHLAALTDVVSSIQHPLEYHRANVDGTITVLEAARSAAVKRFVYTASSSCYGIPDEFPTREIAPIRAMYPSIHLLSTLVNLTAFLRI